MKQRLLIFILVLLSAISANAYDAKIDGIYYDFNSSTKEAIVTSEIHMYGSSYTGSVTIPEAVTYNNVTYSVTEIGFGAFDICYSLTSVTIPNSVKSIGTYAIIVFRDL